MNLYQLPKSEKDDIHRKLRSLLAVLDMEFAARSHIAGEMLTGLPHRAYMKEANLQQVSVNYFLTLEQAVERSLTIWMQTDPITGLQGYIRLADSLLLRDLPKEIRDLLPAPGAHVECCLVE